MPLPNKEVTYDIDRETHRDPLIIPERVRKTLGITDDENPRLHVIISNPETEDIILDEVITYYLSIDPEIIEPKTRAVIESHQHLRITVSRVS